MLQSGLRGRVNAALGKVPLTLAVNNARILNVFTGELLPGSIGVYGDTIVYVGKERKEFADRIIDAKGQIAIPGLIDTHLHVESSMITPLRFAEAILPCGTTTICADPHEIANVLGKEGVRMMLENSRNLPLKMYFFAPTCVPESRAVTSGSELLPQDIEEMLGWAGICGLGEVMDYDSVLSTKRKMIEILEIGRRRKVVIDGHCPLLSGAKLAAYLASGAEADHENFEVDSAIEKARMGMYLKLRGPDILDTKAFVTSLRKLPSPTNIIFVTDDVMPDRLAKSGHLDHVCRAAIEAGMDPVEVVRSVTLRPAQHIRMFELGAIAPGKIADIVLMNDVKKFDPQTVISNGAVVARNGRLSVRMPKRGFDQSAFHTVRIPKLEAEDFIINYGMTDGEVRLNCIDFSRYRRNNKNGVKNNATSFLEMVLTKLITVDAKIKDGRLDSEEISPALVFERHGKTKRKRGLGFTRNLIHRGAIATTISHDAHNLLVVGREAEDMLKASNLVINSQGGMAAVRKGEVLAQIRLPIAGLMSDKPLATVAADMSRMRRALKMMGVIDHPYMPIPNLLSLSVIPHARITDKGIYDVDSGKFVRAIL